MDSPFPLLAALEPDCAGILRQLARLGHEVASHSVSHSPVFAQFELGSGGEQFPEYHPSVHSHELTYGGSIMGELRVSRYLLQSLLPDQPVLSFPDVNFGDMPLDTPSAKDYVTLDLDWVGSEFDVSGV